MIFNNCVSGLKLAEKYKILISDCRNTAEFMRQMDSRRGASEYNAVNGMWSKFFVNDLLNSVDLSIEEVAEKCEVPVETARGWRMKAPAEREHYVAIGCCFGLGVKKTSDITARYGGFAKLNRRSARDRDSIRKLKLCANKAGREKRNVSADDSNNLHDGRFYNLVRNLSRKKRMRAAKKFANLIKSRGFPSHFEFLKSADFSETAHFDFSDFIKNGTPPERNLLISAAVHLGCSVKEIDRILGSVYMEPLSARRPYEAALIFVLSEKTAAPLSFEDVYNRLNSGLLREFLAAEKVDIDECMYRRKK